MLDSTTQDRRQRKGRRGLRLWSIGRNEDGSALAFAGVFLPVLAAVGMFAIDLSHIYLTHDRMKVATDAAAVGAALILSDPGAATERAVSLAAENVDPAWGTLTTEDDVEYGSYDLKTRTFSPGTTTVNAVRVSAHRSANRGNAMPTYFAAVFGTPAIELDTASVAVQVASTCVVVLDQTADGALTQVGPGTLTAPGCNIQVNSDSTRALTIATGTVSAKSICVAGEAVGSGADPTPTTGCKLLADPLINLPEPAPFTCSQTSPLIINSMSPDCTYSGTVTIGGSMTLQPGTYDFRNATVTISAGATISGSEVFLFLDGTSTLTMQPGASLQITPPESGPYAGLSLFQSRSAAATTTSSLGSAAGSVQMGAIYMPTSTLQIAGPAQTGKLITGRLSASGPGTVTVSVDANRYAISPRRPTNQRTTLVY